MADRVTFRERTAGVCVAKTFMDWVATPPVDKTGVSITDPRVKFVKGWETGGTDPVDGSVECGDGTAYPMRVTIAQLAELMSRVRDAKWVSGSATQTADDGMGSVYAAVVTLTSVTPPTEKVEWELTNGDTNAAYTRRAWVAVTNDETPDKPMEDYGDTYFSDPTYLTVGGINGGTTYPLAYREAIAERALWANGFPLVDPNQTGYYNADEILDNTYLLYGGNDQFKTGFSFFGQSWVEDGTGVEPTIYAPFSTIQHASAMSPAFPYRLGSVRIAFSTVVAWVDLNESGNPYDSLNEIYVGVRFLTINSFDGNLGLNISHSTDLNYLIGPKSGKLADLKLKLSGAGNYVTAAIYGSEECLYGACVPTSTDWEFEATAWWPYQKLDGSPAWNASTGAPIGDISS